MLSQKCCNETGSQLLPQGISAGQKIIGQECARITFFILNNDQNVEQRRALATPDSLGADEWGSPIVFDFTSVGATSSVLSMSKTGVVCFNNLRTACPFLQLPPGGTNETSSEPNLHARDKHVVLSIKREVPDQLCGNSRDLHSVPPKGRPTTHAEPNACTAVIY